MKLKRLIANAGITGIGFYLFQKRNETPAIVAAAPNASVAVATTRLGAASVLNIDPSVSSAPRATERAENNAVGRDAIVSR